MANEVEIIAKFTTTSAMTAINGFQKKLQETQIIVDKLNDSFSKFGKKSTTAKVNSDIKQATTSINDLSKGVKGATIDLTKMDSQPIKKLQKEADELKKKMNFKSDGPSFGNNMARAFSKVGDEIARSTKLLTAFGLVSGGIIANRAKNEFLKYSAENVQLGNVMGVNDKAGQDMLNSMIANIGHTTGIGGATAIANVKNTASGGITVDLSDKNPNRDRDIKEFAKVQGRIGLFAGAFGATTEEVNKAIVTLGISLGKTPKELNNVTIVNDLLGTLGIALNNGIGSLSEYSTSIGKFMGTYMAAAPEGLDDKGRRKYMAEGMAQFTTETLINSPALAGFKTKAFGNDLANMLKLSKADSTKITNLLKEKKDSAGNIIPFTFLGDKEKTQKVKQFLQPFENADYLRKNIFLKDGKQGTQMDVAENMKTILTKGEKETGLGRSELLTLFTTNVNTKAALIDYMKQSDNVQKLANSFKDEAEGIKIVDNAIKKQEESFAFMYNRVSADFDNLTNQMLNDLTPSMNSLFTIISDGLSGTPTDIQKMNNAFKQNIDTLKQTNPALATAAELMQRFANYIAEGTAEKDLKAIGSAIGAIGTALRVLMDTASSVWNSGPLKAIRDMAGGMGTVIDIGLMVGGYSALKIGLGAAISSVFSKVGGSMAGQIFSNAVITTAGVSLATAFVAGIGAIQLGTTIGEWAYNKFYGKQHNEEMQKQFGDLNTINSISLTNPNLLTLEQRQKNLTIIEANKTKRYTFSNLDSEQKNLISKGIGDTSIGQGNTYKKMYDFSKTGFNLEEMKGILGGANGVMAFLDIEKKKPVATNAISEALGFGNSQSDKNNTEILSSTIDAMVKNTNSQTDALSANTVATNNLSNTISHFSLGGMIGNMLGGGEKGGSRSASGTAGKGPLKFVYTP